MSHRFLFILAAALALPLAAGCSDGASLEGDGAQATTSEAAVTASSATASAKTLKKALKKAARGLEVTSETDSPLTYVEAKIKPSEAVTPELVIAKLDLLHQRMSGDDGSLAERFVQKNDMLQFIADNSEFMDDPADAPTFLKWKALGQLMDSKLTDKVYFRFQTNPADDSDGGTITIFVGGRANGRLVGFFAEAAET